MEYQPPAPPTPGPSSPQKTSMGLEPNVASGLAYVCGLVTGLIFFLLEKEDKLVRFHAMQSILTFAAFFVIFIGLSIVGLIPVIGIVVWILDFLVGGIAFVIWIICMVKGFQGEKFKLPVVGDMAEKYI